METINKTNFIAIAVYLELQDSFCIELKELSDIMHAKYTNYFKTYRDDETISSAIRRAIYCNSKDSLAYSTGEDMFSSTLGIGLGAWESNEDWKLDDNVFDILLKCVLKSEKLIEKDKKLIYSYMNSNKKNKLALKLYDKYCL